MNIATAIQSSTSIEALNRLNDIVTSFCESQMFFAACNLGLFDQLASGPATAATLAERCSVHPGALHRLLIGLSESGILVRHGETFANSALASQVTSSSSVPFQALVAWGNLFYPAWGNLADAVRENSPRWMQTFGASQQDTFANLYQDPVSLRRFCALMSAYSIPQGQLLADSYDFSQHQCILDVAGGSGGLIIAIGRKFAHLRGIVMDLPPVCALATEAIEAAGLESRFRAESADLMNGPYPSGADTIALSWILHDWNDENCRTILRHCWDALPANGTLLITESVLNNDFTGTPFGVLMSLHMLLFCETGARERTENEYREMLRSCGFRMEKLMRLNAPRDLIVARKVV